MKNESTRNQYQLFKSSKFAPFFWTQFLGALNDNVFKTALLAIITYRTIRIGPFGAEMLVNICAGIFILPFFLFSATAGQLADKFEKSRLIRYVKLLEIFTMTLAIVGLYLDNISFLLGVLFLLGTQSALFGPAKYSTLPQLVDDTELLGGNGLVEMGTFMAILLGTLYSGIIIQFHNIGVRVIATSCFIIAIAGYLCSRKIKHLPPQHTDIKLSYNIAKQTYNSIKLATEKPIVFLSILGISWFWFFGSVVVTQIFNYGRLILIANETVVTAIITCFSIGIGLGSLSCEKLSGHKIEIGLVPLGAIGLTVFSTLLYVLQPLADTHDIINLSQFLQAPHNWLLIVNFILIGFFSGIFIVPLYTLIQQRSDPQKRARIIAANNILNALFMVFASIFAIICFSFHMIIPQIYLLAGILNLLVALCLFALAPEFIMRSLIWSLVSSRYRITLKDIEEHIPTQGPGILLCNRVNFMDPLILLAAIRRPVRCVIDPSMLNSRLLRFIFRIAKAIPMDATVFNKISHALEKGELVVIFPEKEITQDGTLQPFHLDIETIIQRNPAPIIPMILKNLGSQWPKCLRTPIYLTVGENISSEEASQETLVDAMLSLQKEDGSD